MALLSLSEIVKKPVIDIRGEKVGRYAVSKSKGPDGENV